MAKGSDQILLQRQYTNGHKAHEKILNNISHMEMQSKITMRYHFTLTRMAVLLKKKRASVGKDLEKLHLSCTAGGCEVVQPTWKTV